MANNTTRRKSMAKQSVGKKVTLDDLAKETLPDNVNSGIDRIQIKVKPKRRKKGEQSEKPTSHDANRRRLVAKS
jgi:hypothetical protein